MYKLDCVDALSAASDVWGGLEALLDLPRQMAKQTKKKQRTIWFSKCGLIYTFLRSDNTIHFSKKA